MEFSNLSIHIASLLIKDEFEEWVVFCRSIWLARNYLSHGNVVREPQDAVTQAENVLASLRASTT